MSESGSYSVEWGDGLITTRDSCLDLRDTKRIRSLLDRHELELTRVGTEAYAIVWDTALGLVVSNIERVVTDRCEAEAISDISNDSEAQANTPRYGYIPVLITPRSESNGGTMADKKWIQKAVKHPGQLHRDLGVPQGQKIPAGKLASAKAGNYGKATQKRANLAGTLKKMGK